MSASKRHVSNTLYWLVLISISGSLGCWEQWSESWFPQMKWQKAVGAFEEVDFHGQTGAFMPPDGTVPIDGGEAPVSNIIDAASDGLSNPRAMSMESLNNGKEQYDIYCETCHGGQGLGDGNVSMMGPIQGPLAAVLPIGGPASIAKIRSDGHLYTTIRYGRRRMPGYGRIPIEDRWDIVNYLRYLNGQKGVQP